MKNDVKRFRTIVLTVIVAVVLISCTEPETEPEVTPGLEFWLRNNNTAYSVSRGLATAATVVIPPVFRGLPVVAIAAGWNSPHGFQNYTEMTSIIIPDSVTSIGSGAFFGCSNLESITIPFVGETLEGTSNTHFGFIFWASSSSGHSRSIPASLKTVIITGGNSIGNSAFAGWSGLTRITIPNSVTSIGSSAFSDCSGLTSISIPDSVTRIGSLAFSGCSGLTSITIPNSVTSIGSGAFFGCSNLESITIPFVGETLEGTSNTHFGFIFATQTSPGSISIQQQNGSVPASLRTVVITGGDSIGDSAFSGCSGLTSITIPNSVTSIGNSAFAGCTGLTNIILQSINPPTLGTNVFPPNVIIYVPNEAVTAYRSRWSEYSSQINSVDVINSIDGDFHIGDNVLIRYLGNSESVTIPNGITTIGTSAFAGNSSVTRITIPASVTSIGSSAFEDCIGLTSITIPNSVTSIGRGAFQGCTGLTSITIPFVGETLDGNTNTHFGFIFGASLSDQQSTSSTPIPASLRTVVITGGESIANSAFSGCIGLTSITIPNSVTRIGNSAFEGCTGLTSITIPNSVTSIGSSAFSRCTSLASIIIPDGVTSIGSSTFSGCTSLTNITIPNSVTSIGSSAFEGCTSLASITIPDGVTSIGSSAFSGCTSLTSITIPDSVTSIGSSAFSGCARLTSITIPFVSGTFGSIFGQSNSSVPASLRTVVITGGDSIANSAFSGFTGLTSITIPDSVTSIGSSAFADCRGLRRITIPDSVTTIGRGAFRGCSNLESITIPFIGERLNGHTNTHFGFIFSQEWGSPSVWEQNSSIPASLRTVVITGGNSIGNSAFSNCRNITSIIIPDSVTSIGSSAFADSGLTSIVIPSSVTSISDNTFSNCVNLESITIPNSVSTIGNSAFSGCSGLIRVLFGGTDVEAWNALTINTGNTNLINAIRYYYSTTNPGISNTYWRFVNGIPTIWN